MPKLEQVRRAGIYKLDPPSFRSSHFAPPVALQNIQTTHPYCLFLSFSKIMAQCYIFPLCVGRRRSRPLLRTALDMSEDSKAQHEKVHGTSSLFSEKIRFDPRYAPARWRVCHTATTAFDLVNHWSTIASNRRKLTMHLSW